MVDHFPQLCGLLKIPNQSLTSLILQCWDDSKGQYQRYTWNNRSMDPRTVPWLIPPNHFLRNSWKLQGSLANPEWMDQQHSSHRSRDGSHRWRAQPGFLKPLWWVWVWPSQQEWPRELWTILLLGGGHTQNISVEMFAGKKHLTSNCPWKSTLHQKSVR